MYMQSQTGCFNVKITSMAAPSALRDDVIYRTMGSNPPKNKKSYLFQGTHTKKGFHIQIVWALQEDWLIKPNLNSLHLFHFSLRLSPH